MICDISIEDTLHAIRNCLITSNLWRAIVPQMVQITFFSLSLHALIAWNLEKKKSPGRKFFCGGLLVGMETEK